MSKIDWKNITVAYSKTPWRYHAYHDGKKWSDGELTTNNKIELIESACVLQYAQTAFEGMKAFYQKNGNVVLFRPDQNAARFDESCDKVSIPPVGQAKFLDAVKKVVAANRDYVPPVESGASLYIRPYAFGSTPIILCQPADEYHFRVFCTPFPAIAKNGLKLYVGDFDRAAPNGTGHVKAGLNYAMAFQSLRQAKKLGFDYPLFLDPLTRKYIEETNISNIIFVTRDKKIVTPKSSTILPSITRQSILQVAKDYLGIECETRQISVEELSDFTESAVCGTAATITTLASITHNSTEYKYNIKGEVSLELYNTYKKIQLGEIPAPDGWIVNVD